MTIKNSLVNGRVDDDYTGHGFGPLVMTDVEINAPNGAQEVHDDIYETNWYGWRLNVHGGRGGAQCDGYCELHDSYVHDFLWTEGLHVGAFLTNGAYGAPILLDHNSFLCSLANQSVFDGNGGCTSDVNFLPDFSAITNATVTNNLFIANPSQEYYCVYTGTHIPSKPYPTGTNDVWRNNTFQRGSNGKCGGAGPVFDWAYNSGNVWSGNVWDDGSPLAL